MDDIFDLLSEEVQIDSATVEYQQLAYAKNCVRAFSCSISELNEQNISQGEDTEVYKLFTQALDAYADAKFKLRLALEEARDNGDLLY